MSKATRRDKKLGRVVTESVRTRNLRLLRYPKFLLVGLVNAAVDLLVLNAFLLVHPTLSSPVLLTYNTLAVICAIATGYVLNRRWTFRDRTTNTWRERLLFWIQGGINVLINDLILLFLSRYIIAHLHFPLVVSSNVAKGVAMASSSSVSYLILHFVVFRKKPETSS
ncbi:MAG: GtrA family protein [Firmicutes bacterium]|nr:GtrA family protein [Bacillota bacterium]